MRILSLMFVLLLVAPLYAQENKINPVDSLAQGDVLFAAREYEKARTHYETAANAAIEQGNNEIATEALAQVARLCSIAKDFEEGRKWLEKAKQRAKEAETKGWSRYLGVRGRFEWQDEKDNAKAKKTFVEMHDFCVKHALHSRALDAAHMVAIVGTPADQEEWALKAIAAAEKANEKGWLAVLWNNLGWSYDEKNEVEKAFVALLKARKYHYETGSDHNKLVADFSLGHAYRRIGMLEEARKTLTVAHQWAIKRHEEDKQDKERGEWVGWGHKYLADLLVDEGKPADALKAYKECRPWLVKADIEKWWPEGLKEIDDKIARLEK